MTSTTTLSKKAIHDDDVYTTESTDVSDVEVKEKEPKKPTTNSIETKAHRAQADAHRIFTMLLRHVLRMLRDIHVSVIAYLDDLLI
ncbi:hypothetical protein ACTFIW_000821 [Dictyostelium discoideum]